MKIIVSDESYVHLASIICDLIQDAAQKRGTGIAKRSPEYIGQKISKGQSVLAIENGEVAGFCYIESWSHEKYVVNSGLIVHPDYREKGLAKAIKTKIFELSKKLYPEAKIFGITTSAAVMRINSDLGYKPVVFSELTTDEMFWKGCQSCVNYDILTRTNRQHCLCTGMMYDPAKQKTLDPKKKLSKQERWNRFKDFMSGKNKKSNQLKNKDKALS